MLGIKKLRSYTNFRLVGRFVLYFVASFDNIKCGANFSYHLKKIFWFKNAMFSTNGISRKSIIKICIFVRKNFGHTVLYVYYIFLNIGLTRILFLNLKKNNVKRYKGKGSPPNMQPKLIGLCFWF